MLRTRTPASGAGLFTAVFWHVFVDKWCIYLYLFCLQHWLHNRFVQQVNRICALSQGTFAFSKFVIWLRNSELKGQLLEMQQRLDNAEMNVKLLQLPQQIGSLVYFFVSCHLKLWLVSAAVVTLYLPWVIQAGFFGFANFVACLKALAAPSAQLLEDVLIASVASLQCEVESIAKRWRSIGWNWSQSKGGASHVHPRRVAFILEPLSKRRALALKRLTKNGNVARHVKIGVWAH